MDKNNIPAFPSNISNDPQMLKPGINQGMTLRDYFAGQVVGSLYLASKDLNNITRDDIVAESYHYAEAMLRFREENHANQ
jgi:hypothetical protein